MCFVSVVLPAYKLKFLEAAIDSILNQSFTNFELIIVNDASPEDLDSLIHFITDPRITYLKNAENIGGKSLVKQWNHCIQFANGDYIVLAADDDVYDSEFLQKCVDLAIKYPEVDIIRSMVEQIDENNKTIGIDGIIPEKCSKYEFLYSWYKATTFTCIGNYMFKASVLKMKGFIEFPFAFGSDVSSTILFSENGIANTNQMLFKFRISSYHLSSNQNLLFEKLQATTKLYLWLFNLKYDRPSNKFDAFYYEETSNNRLYEKCVYDYYNQVIKFLPIRKILAINKCELLKRRDKIKMAFRFILSKLL